MVNTWPVGRQRLDLAEAHRRDRGDRLVHRVEAAEAEQHVAEGAEHAGPRRAPQPKPNRRPWLAARGYAAA